MTDSVQIKKFFSDENVYPEISQLVKSGEIAPEFLSADMNGDRFVDRDEFVTTHKLMNPDLDAVTANALFDDGAIKINRAKIDRCMKVGRKQEACEWALKDPDPKFRYEMVSNIELLAYEGVNIKPLLKEALNDPDIRVRHAAIWAFYNLIKNIDDLKIWINAALKDNDPLTFDIVLSKIARFAYLDPIELMKFIPELSDPQVRLGAYKVAIDHAPRKKITKEMIYTIASYDESPIVYEWALQQLECDVRCVPEEK